MARITVESLSQKCIAIFESYGVPRDEAEIITDSIVFAHTRGKHTHGIGRIGIYRRKIREGLMNSHTPLTIIKDSPVITILDAQNGFGQVAGIRGMEICIEKARKFGIGVVGIKDSNNFGTAGFIGQYASNRGMIGIVLANSGPAIAPSGCGKALFGTNPICVSFPTLKDYPDIIFDMACSNAARGKIRLAAKNGEKIPFGWAVDADGNPTDNPNEALKGTMLPIGDYKGYGIALCVDILAGMLTGSGFAGAVRNLNHPSEISRYGHLLIAINPEFFLTRDEFNKDMISLIEQIKACGDSHKGTEPFLPGEKSYYTSLKNIADVDIKQNMLDELEFLYQESLSNSN